MTVHIISEDEDEERDSSNTAEVHNTSDEVQYHDDPSLDQDTLAEPEHCDFKTKHGLEIYKEVGRSEDLQQYDVLRQNPAVQCQMLTGQVTKDCYASCTT